MIGINVISGNSSVDEDDKDRARAAALAVLEARGVTPEAAYAVFVSEWAWLATDAAEERGLCQKYQHLWDPLSIAWIEAESAADVALTAGWANPMGASCSIYV